MIALSYEHKLVHTEFSNTIKYPAAFHTTWLLWGEKYGSCDNSVFNEWFGFELPEHCYSFCTFSLEKKFRIFLLNRRGASCWTLCDTSFPCVTYLKKRISNVCAVSRSVLTHMAPSLAEDQRSMVKDGLQVFYAKQSCTQKIHVMLLVKSASFSHGTLFTVLLSFVRY